MRLGQLSRKLGIHTSKIIDFLASKDIVVNEDSNTRIEDEYVTWITQKYAPQLMAEVSNTLSEEKIEPTIHTPFVEEVAPTEEQPVAVEAPPLPELIKAPKIELSGLKVLGKIEIPEKKKIATSQEQPESTSSDSISTAERKKNPRKEFTPRPQKNPVALQREREEREAERKGKIATRKGEENVQLFKSGENTGTHKKESICKRANRGGIIDHRGSAEILVGQISPLAKNLKKMTRLNRAIFITSF
jgi:hypothetical protein